MVPRPNDPIVRIGRAFSGNEDLRLALQSPKCLRMNDAIPIALEREARLIIGFGNRSAQYSLQRNCGGGKERVGLVEPGCEGFHGLIVLVHAQRPSGEYACPLE